MLGGNRSARITRGVGSRSLVLIPAFCLPAVLCTRKASGQLLYQLNGFSYNQNFNSLPTTGSSNPSSSLPLEFGFNESPGNITFAADNGSNSAGDTYSYGATGSS